MALLSRYRALPPSMSGRFRHDPMLGLADIAINTMLGVTRLVRRPAPPPNSTASSNSRSRGAKWWRTTRTSSP